MEFNYKAWIPTNNGELSGDRVGNSYPANEWELKDNILTLNQTNIDDYSDTVFNTKGELPISYKLTINFKTNPWKFELSIFVEELELIGAKGTIETNGMTIFTISKRNFQGDDVNISNTIFTIVKNCVHGNGHHEQKVDKFIPVQKINHFKYSHIAKCLADHIKQNEFEAKRISSDNTTNAHKLSVVNNLNEQAKGFKSYYDTFCKIFKQDIEKENLQIGYPDSVLMSLGSIKNKLEIESTNKKFAISIFFSILAFFISSNILIKPILTSSDTPPALFQIDNYYLLLTIVFAISILIAIFIDLRYMGIIKAVFTPVFKAKEFYQRIYLYGEAVKKYNKKIPKGKGKYYIYYYLFRIGKYSFGILFLMTLIYGLYINKEKIQFNLDNNTTKKQNMLAQSTKVKISPKMDKNISKK